ncbi:hypothetical protein SAY86_001263 [Trapa natans]|uniref:Rhamnogalacturonan lyase domain-containing protein n=1 Tax=Trapa natans TaxID=22666 RepID=A0AAN7RHG9_TRANT|nr:hypothetical protein SAY86_001263 [Trapa natans]
MESIGYLKVLFMGPFSGLWCATAMKSKLLPPISFFSKRLSNLPARITAPAGRGANQEAPTPGIQPIRPSPAVVLDNGIVRVTLANPEGSITGIQYCGVDNLLEVSNGESNRGYWDVVWSAMGTTRTKGVLDRLEGTELEVVVQNEEQVELSFTRSWNFSLSETVVPMNVDKRFVLLRGSSGFYTYAIYEHLAEWPGFIIDNTRTVFKLRKDKFHYMAIADNRQRFMPLPDDRDPPRGQVLAYPEAVRLVDPVEPEFQGEFKLEEQKWPYSFPASEDFTPADQRGKVSGRLLLLDRKKENGTYEGTAWQIKFTLDAVDANETYTLQVALATAHVSEVQIRFNKADEDPPLFTTGVIGRDNTIARHGIHGLYWYFTVNVPGIWLSSGENTIFLRQKMSGRSPFQGVMYDYIRFEGPSYSRPA